MLLPNTILSPKRWNTLLWLGGNSVRPFNYDDEMWCFVGCCCCSLCHMCVRSLCWAVDSERAEAANWRDPKMSFAKKNSKGLHYTDGMAVDWSELYILIDFPFARERAQEALQGGHSQHTTQHRSRQWGGGWGECLRFGKCTSTHLPESNCQGGHCRDVFLLLQCPADTSLSDAFENSSQVSQRSLVSASNVFSLAYG